MAVHLRGEVALREPETLREHLDHLSEVNENRLKPKKPWTMDKMTEDVAEKLMRMLVPMRMTIRTVEQTWEAEPEQDRRHAPRRRDRAGDNGFRPRDRGTGRPDAEPSAGIGPRVPDRCRAEARPTRAATFSLSFPAPGDRA